MSPEGQKPSELNILAATAIIGGIYLLSQFAFSSRVRKEIRDRDGNKSVLSGSTEHLEVAHINHSKRNPKYNDPSNGRVLSTAEHLWDHINRDGRNGLTPHQNSWAIMRILERWINQDEGN